MTDIPDDERLTLFIGDGDNAVINPDWINYDVDSNLLTPADAWSLTMSFKAGRLPPVARSGQQAVLKMGSDIVMSGRIDDVKSRVARGAVTIGIKGRDMVGQLLDCSAPIFSEQNLGFSDVVAKLVRPFGVTKIQVPADKPLRDKIVIQPGEKAWDVLRHAAEAVGLWPWAEPDGTLVIGGPDYSAAPVAMLIHRLDQPEQNNVLSLDVSESVARSYSQVTVLGQAHGGGHHRKASNIKGVYTDPSVTFYRPLVVVDHEIESAAMAKERAHKLASDARLERWTCEVSVRGHRINSPGFTGHGKAWRAGARVHLVDETHGLDGIYYVIGRRFAGGWDRLRTTVLTLKEDGAWIVAAHPHKKRGRRGGDKTLQTLDLSHGAVVAGS